MEKKERKPHDLTAFYTKSNTPAGYVIPKQEDRRSLRRYSPANIRFIDKNYPGISAVGTHNGLIDFSRRFFAEDGFYRRIIIHYATVLEYSGILVPVLGPGVKITEKFIEKRYHEAVTFIENINIKGFFRRCAKAVLVDGVYYGFIKKLDKKNFTIVDLSPKYCRSEYRDFYGNDIVEFNVAYFDTIIKEDARRRLLRAYPEEVETHYRAYKANQGVGAWVKLPSGVGISFTLLDNDPPFLAGIDPSLLYKETIELEVERAREEIRKLIVQQIPHLADGQLLFEPAEAKKMHEGTVDMLKGNENLGVLTTYAKVDSVTSNTTGEASRAGTLNAMAQNVYQQTGVSGELFAATNSQALKYSIANDISYMMILADQFSRFTSTILNALFEKPQISFKYNILPVGRYNASEYITDSMKLASTGYSFLVPAVALGISQRDLVSLKDLENELLKLEQKLIPLSSAYTQSKTDGEGPGRPKLPPEERSDKTRRNLESQDKEGSDA